jgi:ABC-type multidrug transport system fused ATPase/permease subunit
MNEISFPAPSERKKWFVALGIAIGALPIMSLYIYLYLGTITTPAAWMSITAGVAGVLLATSIGAGSVSYYTGWPHPKAGYQKQIGELAFWICLLYCVQLLVFLPERYFYGFLQNIHSPDISLGLTAMVIFGLMTMSHSKIGRQYLTWEQIKFILGFGFVAYSLLIFRALALEVHIWVDWFITFEGLPTPRFVLSALAFLVLILRASIIIHRNIFPRRK